MSVVIGRWSIGGSGFSNLANRVAGAWIGRVGPWFPQGWPAPEVGWTIAPEHLGQGYGTEAARAAVAHAFHKIPGVRVIVLFPIAEVSESQRKLMTTLKDNVRTVAIEGKFDDCQAMVKRAFADPTLQHIPLSSANSINIGRLLPQAFYYPNEHAHLWTDIPFAALLAIICYVWHPERVPSAQTS